MRMGTNSAMKPLGMGSKMKILHVGKFYPPENGGIESVTYECVRGLKALGHDVDVICTTNDKGLVGVESNGRGSIHRCRSYGTLMRASVSPSFVAKLRSMVSKYDAVSIHMPNPLPLVALSGLKNIPPLFLHWHADVSTYGLGYKVYAAFEKAMLEKCAAVVVATRGHYDTSPALIPREAKVKVIPYGIDAGKFTSSAEAKVELPEGLSGKKIVFSLGRFVPYKGFDNLIRAAALLPADYLVVIAGDGPMRSPYQQMIEELGLSQKVVLPGRIDNEHLSAYYSACKVFCLPSVTTAEAFGVVLIEAMSFGKPVISTRLGNGVEWVTGHGETGLTVPVNDPKALASAVLNLLDDSETYESFSRRASARFKSEFTTEIMASRLSELYSSAVRQ